MARTNTDRQIELRDSFVERLKANWRFTIQFHRTHEQYLQGRMDTFGNPKFNKLPYYMRCYVRGVDETLAKSLHVNWNTRKRSKSN